VLRFSANISTLFRELPWLERPQAAADAGFSAIEIQFPYQIDVSEWQGVCQDAGVDVVLINMPPADLEAGELGLACWPGYEDQFARGLQRALDYARALQCPQVNCLAGNVPVGADRRQCWDTLVNNLRLAAETLATVNIRLLVEVMNPHDLPRWLLNSSAEGDAILAEVGVENLQLQYDVYHRCRAGEPWLENLIARLDRVGHIQFSDCPGRREPGSGTMNLPELFRWLETADYQGWLGAEYFPSGDTLASLSWLRAWRNPT